MPQGRGIFLFFHASPFYSSALPSIPQSQLQGLYCNILMPMDSYGRGQEMGILK